MASPTSAGQAESSASPAGQVGHLGLVWASVVDDGRVNQPTSEQPRFDGGDKITTSLDSVLYVDAAGEGELSQGCADEIEASGNAKDSHCLMVQFAMDVPASYRAETAGLAPGAMLTPNGRQIDKATITDGVPGAKHVVIAEFYAGGTPGSTVRWEVGSNEQDWKTIKYRIPQIQAFRPISFS